ncbi:MAG: DUF2281 domain-containing protein [Lachnospiraceae bacterium]|nr:DUF2281 domain-containing protein [Lachnospiraceae bacterium]
MRQYLISIAEDADTTLMNSIIAMLKSIPFIKLSETNVSTAPVIKRKLGGLEGRVWMSDDFCAPMEEFEDYM